MIEYIYQLPLQQVTYKNNSYNFRCPLCGDSSVNSSKKRAWFYKKELKWMFHCFNCGRSETFTNFLKNHYPDVFESYLRDNFNPRVVEKIVEKDEKKENLKNTQDHIYILPLDSIVELSNFHPAKKYIIERKIPDDKHHLLYYTDDFTKFANEMTNNRYPDWKFHDHRIVIPFFKRDKIISMFQGRAISYSTMRYITVKVDEDAPKIYGIERVDWSKKVVVVEGPIDSLFLDNGIAMAGSDLSHETISKFFDKSQIIILMDVEPRNRQINNKIEKFLNLGYNVCLLPEEIRKYGKDINELILNGLTISEVNDIIHKNIYNGLEGILKHKLMRIR